MTARRPSIETLYARLVRASAACQAGRSGLPALAGRALMAAAESLLLARFVLGAPERHYGSSRRQRLGAVVRTALAARSAGLRNCRRELRRLARESLGVPRSAAGAGREPAPAALPADARRVLFLCRGNVIRSPMAAALLRAHAARANLDLQVASAGLHARSGEPADARARRAAASFGVSLEEHLARACSRQVVDDADLVLVMDRSNRADFLSQYPDAADKLFVLPAVVGSGRSELLDPFFGDVETVRRCYAALDEDIRALVHRLQSARAGAPEREAAGAR